MRTLEERVLRVLYEGALTAPDCANELNRYDGDPAYAEIGRLLADLAERRLLAVQLGRYGLRYTLTPRGSERLATLAEASEWGAAS
jgi:DNA-binding PadR family transcriptional regulator